MRKFLKKRLKNERGLTLVELLAVIVILGIIAIIAFVFIGGIIENSKKDAHIANAQQVISAAKLHEATGGKIDETDGINVTELIKQDYLEDIIDPWEKESYDGAATVTKKEDNSEGTIGTKYIYSINDFDAKGCKIEEATELELIEDDRDDICETD